MGDGVIKAAKEYFNIKFQYFRIKASADSIAPTHDDGAEDLAATQPSRITQIKACITEGYPVVFGINKMQKQEGNKWVDTWRPYHEDDLVPEKPRSGAPATEKPPKTDVMREPPDDVEGRYRGGHALLITSYNRDINRDPTQKKSAKLPGAFQVQNSWGSGSKTSRFWLPYSYFESEWVYDIWVIKIEARLNDPHGLKAMIH